MKKFDVPAQVIVMCGISGSGKTHSARQFEEEGYVRLSTDALIWNKMGPNLNNLSKEEQRIIFAQCNKEIRKELIDFIKSGKKIVVDATHCKRSVRDEIRRICEDEEIKPVFLYCSAPKDELLRRLAERKGSGPDDLIVTEEEFQDYWIGFERPQEDETDIIFCNTD